MFSTYVYVPLVCTWCLQNQKMVSGTVEVELETVVGVDAGSSAKAAWLLTIDLSIQQAYWTLIIEKELSYKTKVYCSLGILKPRWVCESIPVHTAI